MCILAANSRGKLTGCILQTWRLVKHAHKNWVMAEGHSICSVKNLVNGHRNNERHSMLSMPIYSMNMKNSQSSFGAPPIASEGNLGNLLTQSSGVISRSSTSQFPLCTRDHEWDSTGHLGRGRPHDQNVGHYPCRIPLVTTAARGSTFACGSASRFNHTSRRTTAQLLQPRLVNTMNGKRWPLFQFTSAALSEWASLLHLEPESIDFVLRKNPWWDFNFFFTISPGLKKK